MENSVFTRAVLGVAVFGLSLTPCLRADSVWTDWTSATVGSPGVAAGTLNGVTVTYGGEVNTNTVIDGSTGDWSDPSTAPYIGGTSTTSPSTVGDIITENGSYTGTNTLTFSSPVVNPIFAIWSLGSLPSPASFTFNITPTFEVGGADQYTGGQAITVSGKTVSGQEGSGVVQFSGTFSSITWTDTFEDYYGFTVGENGPLSSTPEPATSGLLSAGIGGLVLLRRFWAK